MAEKEARILTNGVGHIHDRENNWGVIAERDQSGEHARYLLYFTPNGYGGPNEAAPHQIHQIASEATVSITHPTTGDVITFEGAILGTDEQRQAPVHGRPPGRYSQFGPNPTGLEYHSVHERFTTNDKHAGLLRYDYYSGVINRRYWTKLIPYVSSTRPPADGTCDLQELTASITYNGSETKTQTIWVAVDPKEALHE